METPPVTVAFSLDRDVYAGVRGRSAGDKWSGTISFYDRGGERQSHHLFGGHPRVRQSNVPWADWRPRYHLRRRSTPKPATSGLPTRGEGESDS